LYFLCETDHQEEGSTVSPIPGASTRGPRKMQTNKQTNKQTKKTNEQNN